VRFDKNDWSIEVPIFQITENAISDLLPED